MRRRFGDEARNSIDSAPNRAVPARKLRKPSSRSIGLIRNLVISVAIAPMKVIEPDSNGVRPKPTCSIIGSRNGKAPTTAARTTKLEPAAILKVR